MTLGEEIVKREKTSNQFKDQVQDTPTLRVGKKRRFLQRTLRSGQ
jgi:hypothetical protein